MYKQVLSTTSWGFQDESIFIASNGDWIACYVDYEADGYIKYRVSNDQGKTWAAEQSLQLLTGHTFCDVVTCVDKANNDSLYALVVTGVDGSNIHGRLTEYYPKIYGGKLSYNTGTHTLSKTGFSTHMSLSFYWPYYMLQLKGNKISETEWSVITMQLGAHLAYGPVVGLSSVSMIHDGNYVYISYKKADFFIKTWDINNVVTGNGRGYFSLAKISNDNFGIVDVKEAEYIGQTFDQAVAGSFNVFGDSIRTTLADLDDDHLLLVHGRMSAAPETLWRTKFNTCYEIIRKSTLTPGTIALITPGGHIPRVVESADKITIYSPVPTMPVVGSFVYRVKKVEVSRSEDPLLGATYYGHRAVDCGYIRYDISQYPEETINASRMERGAQLQLVYNTWGARFFDEDPDTMGWSRTDIQLNKQLSEMPDAAGAGTKFSVMKVINDGIEETAFWCFPSPIIYKTSGKKIVSISPGENLGGYLVSELTGASSYAGVINSEYLPIMTQHKGTSDVTVVSPSPIAIPNYSDPRFLGPGVSAQRVYLNILPRAKPLLPSPLQTIVSTGQIDFEWYVEDEDGDNTQYKYQLFLYDPEAVSSNYIQADGTLIAAETSVTSSATSAYLNGGILTGNDQGYLWKVRVADVHDAWGPWCEMQKFWVAEIPRVAWVFPEEGDTITTNYPDFLISYEEDDDERAAYYRLKIYSINNVLIYDSGDQYIVLFDDGYGKIKIPVELQDNTVYVADIYVVDIGGSTSETKRAIFRTKFLYPDDPTISISDYSSSGYLGISLSSVGEYVDYSLFRYSLMSGGYVFVDNFSSDSNYYVSDYAFPINTDFCYQVVTMNEFNCQHKGYSENINIPMTRLSEQWFLVSNSLFINRLIYVDVFTQQPTKATQEYEPVGRTSQIVIGNNAKGSSGLIKFFVFEEDAKDTINELDLMCSSTENMFIKNPFGEVYCISPLSYEVEEMQQNRLTISLPFVEIGEA